MKGKFFLSLIISLILFSCGEKERQKSNNNQDWAYYQGGLDRNQYSPLSQITPSNVKDLKVVWEYHTGDSVTDNHTQIQCNPIIVNGVLYATSPRLDCFALDAATGKEIWKFRPSLDKHFIFSMGVNRGVTYFSDDSVKRIYYAAGQLLIALDATNGKLVDSFGDHGVVNLKNGLLPGDEKLYVSGTSPGVIYKDKLIIGCRVSEDQLSAPGYIRAYNVYTGKIDWVFHTIPQPGEYGYSTWPPEDWDKVGGVNDWAGMSLDAQQGIVYLPLGSAAFDFYGGNRAGMDLYGNCLLALNAETGQRIWHFQTVHHDLWDRDLPAPPNLFTWNNGEKEVQALAQITKSGFIYVFNRITGEPLFPIDNIAVPGSDLRGEKTWPTQPVPEKPDYFARQFISDSDFNDFDPKVRQQSLETFHKIRHGHYFIPPSTEGTLIFPGFDGGGEWGGAAVDPETNIMYVNANEMPWIHTMVDLAPESEAKLSSAGKLLYNINCVKCHGPDLKGDGRNYPNITQVGSKYTREGFIKYISTGRGMMTAFDFLTDEQKDEIASYVLYYNKKIIETPRKVAGHSSDKEGPNIDSLISKVPYTHTGYNRWVDQFGNAVITPPWGTLNAINLNTGDRVWRVPLGQVDSLMALGIPITGTENYGGPVVTAGGLVFIAATKDARMHAFDKTTGKLLWQTKLPYAGYATPSVYEVNGKEYIVVACGGGKLGTKSGDVYVAFGVE